MNTWTCKTGAAFIALSILAACEGGSATDLMGTLASINDKPNAEALSQAPMAFGAVTLVPPSGYCIDGESLRPRFALLARCDKLGGDGGSNGAPIGVMTVSLASVGKDTPLPSLSETATAFDLTRTADPVATANSVVFRATGPAIDPNLSDEHWRGSALVNGQMIGVALYGRPNGAATSGEGRQLVAELIKRTEESNE